MDFSLPAFLPLWFMAWQLGMRTGSSCTSHLSQSLPWGHHVVFAPLASGHRQALTRWCYKRNSGGPAPGTLYFFFSPKRRPFLYFIPPSCLPGDPPAISQCCPGGSLQPAASSCLQNYLIFSFGFFTRAFTRLTAFLAVLCSDWKAMPFFPWQSFPTLFCL